MYLYKMNSVRGFSKGAKGVSTSIMNTAKGASVGVLAASKVVVRSVAWRAYKLLKNIQSAVPIVMMSHKALTLAGGSTSLGSGGFKAAIADSLGASPALNTLGGWSLAAAPFAVASVGICMAIDSCLNGTNDVAGATPLSQQERTKLQAMENALTVATLNYKEQVGKVGKDGKPATPEGDAAAQELVKTVATVSDMIGDENNSAISSEQQREFLAARIIEFNNQAGNEAIQQAQAADIIPGAAAPATAAATAAATPATATAAATSGTGGRRGAGRNTRRRKNRNRRRTSRR